MSSPSGSSFHGWGSQQHSREGTDSNAVSPVPPLSPLPNQTLLATAVRNALSRRRTETDARFLSSDGLISDEEGRHSPHLDWDNYDIYRQFATPLGGSRTASPPPHPRMTMMHSPPRGGRSKTRTTDPTRLDREQVLQQEHVDEQRRLEEAERLRAEEAEQRIQASQHGAVGDPAAPLNPATQISPQQQALLNARLEVQAAIAAWEDDFLGIEISELPLCVLRQKMNECDEHKKVLQRHEPRLDLAGPPMYPAALRTKVTNARRDLALTWRNMGKALTALEEIHRQVGGGAGLPTGISALPAGTTNGVATPPSPAAAAATIKIPIVQQNVQLVQSQIEDMLAVIREINVVPSDERGYSVFCTRTASAFRQIKSVKDFAAQVIDEAAQCALVTEMTETNTQLLSLREQEDGLRSTEQTARAKYGAAIDGKEFMSKPPKFSGDPKDGNDFFSFKKEWDEFRSQKNGSDAHLLRILLNDSLTGSAKTSCKELESEKLVFRKLNKLYGNVVYLIQFKIGEIYKLKKCEGSSVKCREWLIEVSSKMSALEKLAVEHEREEKVYHSDVVDHVLKSLPLTMKEGFLTYAQKKLGIADSEPEDGDSDDEEEREQAMFRTSTARTMYKTLILYLEKRIKKATFNIDFELSTCKGRDDKAPAKDPPPRPSQTKPAKAYVAVEAAATGQPASNPPASVSKPTSRRDKQKAKKSSAPAAKPATGPPPVPAAYAIPASVKCTWCQSSHSNAFYCTEFQKTATLDRQKMCFDARVCFKCLRLDTKVDVSDKEWFKKHKADCDVGWVCDVDNCEKKMPHRRTHFLLCHWHSGKNKKREAEFIKQLDQNLISPGTTFLTMYPSYFCDPSDEVPVHLAIDGYDIEPDTNNNSVFMLQNFVINGETLLLFYDGGCHGAGISDHAAKVMKSTCVRPGPTVMNVAGGGTVEIKHGHEQFAVPLVEKQKMFLCTGLRMDEITSAFPTWNVDEAWVDIYNEFTRSFPGCTLPNRPGKMGGKAVDLLLGIRYVKYFPTLLFTLPSGLAIFESKIAAPNGETLVLAGPHESWNYASSQSSLHSAHIFFSNEMRAYYFHSQVLTTPISLPSPELEELHDLCLEPFACHEVDFAADASKTRSCSDESETSVYNVRNATERLFSPDIFGTEVDYRCYRCRNCNDCKNSEHLNQMSLKEEREQYLIDKCVSFCPKSKKLVSDLPFISDPESNIKPNRRIAECILASQLKITSGNDQIKSDVLAAHNKLRSRGFVVKLSELEPEIQDLIDIEGDRAHYFIPWRMMWKPTSLSSPGRMVFDASSCTPGGSSLNSILAKGENRLSKLFDILLKFRAGMDGYTADISMAYNNVYLNPEFYRFQLYLWKEELDVKAPSEIFVVRTLIYGVRPSGNLMLAAFKLLTNHCMDYFPEHEPGARALEQAYVDDLLHATRGGRTARQDAESLLFVLSLGNLSIKGFTFSGEAPPPEVSSDGKTVGLLGMVWESESDKLSADCKPVFFGRVKRGKLPELVTGDLKTALEKNFTKRTVLSKLASLYDPVGLLSPLTVRYKLDFSTICELKTGWDDLLPPEYLDTWVANIKEIQECKSVQFDRSVIPGESRDSRLEIIISTDASQYAAACVAHARVPLADGGFSAKLLCARTKITKNLTIPKAELRAMVMGASLGHVIKVKLGDQVSDIIYVTDSTIALHQVNLDSRPMEVFTRNCVVEIRRLSDPESWFHVESGNNIADLATKDATLADIGPNSDWQNGRAWMKLDREKMPLQSVSQLLQSVATPVNNMVLTNFIICNKVLSPKVKDRYLESKYLYDPNKYGWVRAVRVMALVCKFVRKQVKSWNPVYAPPKPPADEFVPVESGQFNLTKYDIRFGMHYYFYLATLEVQRNVPAKDYQSDTVLRYGILHHTGRILDGHQIDVVDQADKFIDLEPLSFLKPVADRYSPVAYSVMIHAHSSVLHHRTTSATLTESRTILYVFNGRSLAKQVRQACQFCRLYKLRLVRVEMSPVDSSRLTIAPPFYITQIDLAGPFPAHSEHNLRSIVKIWLCVFKCPATCAVDIHVATKYSTAAVVQAYTRFAKSHGHPGLILVDQGTQLVAACNNMKISIIDLTQQLNCRFQVGVEYRACPARAHNYQGCVERTIQEVKKLLNKVVKGIKLDIMTWETMAAWAANELNHLPIAVGSKTDLDNLDVITPSRLLLGRNNRRAMSGYPRLDAPSRMMRQQDELYDLWWKIWRNEKLVDYIPQPKKWRENDREVCVGDIVAFVKEEAADHFGKPVYKVGRVAEVEHSADGRVRACVIEYKNASNPDLVQRTRVSVRHVAVVHAEDDLDLIQQLNAASHQANLLYHSKS